MIAADKKEGGILCSHPSEQALQIFISLSKLSNKLPVSFFTTMDHFQSTELVQDVFSSIRDFLPNVPHLITFGEIGHYNEQNE